MTKKFYLTRTQTRAMAADHPIGDPTGGAAYGEKNDPVTAIISIASMAGTYAAAGSFAAMTLMQGITFAGAALSLVGNVTGNKTLSKIGMIAGIAGGVGMFADSVLGGAPIGGTVGEAFGKSTVTDAMLADPNTLAQTVTPVVDGKAVVPSSSPANVNAVPDPSAATQSLTTAPNINTPTALGPPMAPADYSLANAAKTAGGMGTKLSTAVTGPPPPGVIDSLKAGNYGQALSTAGGNAMDMLKTNPTGAYVAAQAVGAAADFLSGKTDAELDALKANTGYANAKALEVQAALDREKMRRANLNSGYTNVDAGFKVNPNAAVTQPYQQPPGLVASAMQPRQG